MKDTRDDTLKIVGIITMVIDHVGMVFFPGITVLRVIGRLAFPIFAYYLAEGYIHTSNIKKYLLRLFVFALIAQIPFQLVSETKVLNIFFSLFLGLLSIYAYDKKKYLALLSIILISGIISVDYSFYGILIMLSFYVFKKREIILVSQIVTNFALIFMNGIVQPFSLAGTFLVLYYPKDLPRIRINKYFFYVFYPVHLLIIYGISRIMLFPK